MLGGILLILLGIVLCTWSITWVFAECFNVATTHLRLHFQIGHGEPPEKAGYSIETWVVIVVVAMGVVGAVCILVGLLLATLNGLGLIK